jgi:quercetin dioxygenase-like cupin family protein
MLRRAAGGLILALVIAATGSAAVLGVALRTANEAPDPTGEFESSRTREIEALLDTTRKSSALCTSAPTEPERQSKQTAKEEVMKKALVAAGLIALAGSVFAHDSAGTDGAKEFVAEEIVFRDDPAFPKGAQTVVLHGDPAKPGLFILRAKFPPNYVVPPHTHPGFETVTVLTGAMGSGMGEKADLTKGKMLQAGGMLALPANHAHYVWTTDEETIIQVAAVGPFDLVYINPEDDPRKK